MYKLSNEQKRIWISEQIMPNSSAYIIGGCLKIDGNILIDKMNRVLNKILATNDCLRIRITKNKEEVSQIVYPFQERKFEVYDFSERNDGQNKFDEWVANQFRKTFILEENDLFYFAIYQLPDHRSGVLVKLHHLIADGWTMGLLSKEICNRYENDDWEFYGEEKPSYMNYIQRTSQYEKSLQYKKDELFWNDICNRMDEKNFYKSHLSIEGTREIFVLDKVTSENMKSVCKEYNISINLLFMFALAVMVHKTSNQKNIVIGTVMYNRTHGNEKQMMGMFTNNIPVLFEINHQKTVSSTLKEAKKGYYDSIKHHQYPYDLVVKKAVLDKSGFDSVFKFCVNTYNAQYSSTCNGWDVSIEEMYSGNQIQSLQIVLKQLKVDQYAMMIDYKDEYTHEDINLIYQMLHRIIEQLLTKPQMTISEIELADDEYIKEQLENKNSIRECEYDSVVELIDNISRKYEDKIALEYNNMKMTYKGLIHMSNQFSNYLKERNICKGDRVAIRLKHNFNLFVAILGILKCGAVYVPIAAECPQKRMEFILSDSGCKTIICDDNLKISELDILVIDINQIDYSMYAKESKSTYNKTDLAYIIYTSGSSGTPKGVMIENRGLLNYVMWANKIYIAENDVMACYSSIAFDLTVTSIYIPLISGNKVIIYEETDSDEFVLYRIVKDRKCTIVKLTPSHIRALISMEDKESTLRKLIVGGEDFPSKLSERVSKKFCIDEIYNEYGPTEATVGCMIYRYEGDSYESVPIGKAIDGMKIYIMDKYGRILPKGMRGELCISGIGLAYGYVNLDDLTHSRFVRNAYDKNEIVYRSGDLARYIKDDVMIYCGRINEQIKVNGHRVELSEIRNCLIQMENIKDSAVKILDRGDSKIIIAYVMCEMGLTEQDIKKGLKEVLAEYMIPAKIYIVKEIPTTTNGKVDFNHMEVISVDRQQVGELLDNDILKIVKKFLGISEVYTDSNFIGLGGDSIKAIQISSELRNLGYKLDVVHILNSANIAEMMEKVECIRNEVIIEEEVNDIHDTPIIRWFFHQEIDKKEQYFQYICLKICGNYDKFREILEVIINHHDVFGYEFDDNGICGVYSGKRVLDYEEINDWDKEIREDNIRDTISRLQIKFDLKSGKLLKAFRLKSKLVDEDYLVVCAHHLIMDVYSWQIMLSEIDKLYTNDLDASALRTTDSYLKWAQHIHTMKQIETLSNNSSDKDCSISPTDFVERRKDWQSVGEISVINRVIEQGVVDRICNHNMQKFGLVFKEVLEIAFGLAIHEKCNTNEVVFEIENNGREFDNNGIDVSATIGWFTRFLLKRIKCLDKNESFDKIIKSFKEQLKENIEYSFDKSNQKYIRFNYLGNLDSILFDNSLFNEMYFGLNNESGILSSLCEMNCYIMNKQLMMKWTFESSRYSREFMNEFMNCFVDYLRKLEEYMSEKEGREFTPSDFKDVSMSQDLLDQLFE